jgi:hypothetical protein
MFLSSLVPCVALNSRPLISSSPLGLVSGLTCSESRYSVFSHVDARLHLQYRIREIRESKEIRALRSNA